MSLSNITVHTGLPGAGKTLFTISMIHQVAKVEKVPVYYCGIPECKVPGWIELEDATRWPELPPKSILIIDEAQRIFRPRHVGSTVPQYVAELETIRHKGIRLVLITQHPKLLEPNVRRLCGKHRHYIRAYGSKVVSVHEWDELKDSCETSGGRADSMRTTQAHPVEVYKWYKSAEVHTVQRSIPKRLILAVLIPFVVIAMGYTAAKFMMKRADGKKPEAIATSPQAIKQRQPGEPGKAGPEKVSAVEYIDLRRPRIAGLAYTAPVYDSVTTVTAAPFPSACAQMGEKCRCYTEQATILEMDDKLCKSIVERGFFREFAASRQEGERGAQRPVASMTADASPAKSPAAPGPSAVMQVPSSMGPGPRQ